MVIGYMDSKKANGTVGSHRSAIELRAYVRCAQILLMMRQMDAAGTQALASKVSLVSLGQQAIMDAHLCLLHLTTGASPHGLCMQGSDWSACIDWSLPLLVHGNDSTVWAEAMIG